MIDPEQHNPTWMVGRTIAGRYKIRATIGSGGMGFVYRATQFPIEREVALKVLRADLAHQEGIAERFTREARAASRIKHPNAITIYEFGESDGTFYLAMELLYGETLRQRLRREPPLLAEQALDMFEAMAGALGAAHRVGVVHRDLKPDNIFLSQMEGVGEVIKVLDFGLAKLLDRGPTDEGLQTDVNLRLGTPRYMAPEQALGVRPIDARCDVYALGLLLFEMLARRAPFMADDGMEVLAQRLRRDAPKLSQVNPEGGFGEHLDQLLGSLLMRDREHRPADANEVLLRLRELRKGGLIYRSGGEDEGPPTIQGPPPVMPMVAPTYPARSPWASGRVAALPQAVHEPLVSREVPAVAAPIAAPLVSQAGGDDFVDKPTVVMGPGRPPGGLLEDVTSLAAPTYVQPQPPTYISDDRPTQDGEALRPRRIGTAAWPGAGFLTRRVVVLVLVVAAVAPLLALLLRGYLRRAIEVPDAPPVPEVRSGTGSGPPAAAGPSAPAPSAPPTPVAVPLDREARAAAANPEARAAAVTPTTPVVVVTGPEPGTTGKAAPGTAVRPRSVTIVITSTPAGAAVERDGKSLPGQTPLRDTLAWGLGTVRYRVSAPGYRPREVTVTPDHRRTLAVPLEKADKPAEPPRKPRAALVVPPF